MSTWGWQRWIAVIGLLFVVQQVVLVAIALSAGVPPGPAEEAKLADYVTKNSGTLLAAIFVSDIGLALYLIFASGLRSVLRLAADYEWAAALFFGSALVVIALNGASLALSGAAAIDTGGKVNPASVRALWDAGLVVAWMTTFPLAISIGTVAYATARSRVLPGWTVWVGYVAAFLTALYSFTIFGGSDPSNLFSINGLAGLLLGLLPVLVWVVCVSVAIWRLPANAVGRMRAPA